MLRQAPEYPSLAEMQEMFPDRTEGEIKNALRMAEGVIDRAVSILLAEAPGAHSQSPQSGSYAAPRQESQSRLSQGSSGPQVVPPATRVFRHVFPADFLRWPTDATVVVENTQGQRIDLRTGRVLPPIAPPQRVPVVRIVRETPDSSWQEDSGHLYPQQPGKQQRMSLWNRIKARFAGHSTDYQRVD